MEQTRSVRSSLLIAQSVGRERMLRWQSRFLRLLSLLVFGVATAVSAWLIAGCQSPPRAADPPPPCPAPSDAALDAMATVGPGLAEYLGRMLRYCEGIDELRK
jgi:hypothetical protein